MNFFEVMFFHPVTEFLFYGYFAEARWWELVTALVFTHFTIISVTIFLHRSQAHRAVELSPRVQHCFRFWLWLTTGMVTWIWVALHRKHHAKCEQAEDPHSPHVYGLKTLLLQGAELYRAGAADTDALLKYRHGTPDDWVEQNVYSRHPKLGVGLMLVIDVALFGVSGLAVWAMQMLWIPVMAAGVINGLGHWWGYRKFEPDDKSTNISPWGVLIGGEELHNNHHTFPTSAKLSVYWWEFDIGWLYIRLLELIGWATVRTVPPQAAPSERFVSWEVSYRHVRELQHRLRAELRSISKEAKTQGVDLASFEESFKLLFARSSLSEAALAAALKAWCEKACRESKWIHLRSFAISLRAVRAVGVE